MPMKQNILLVGVVSNVGRTIEKELKIVLKALSSFENVRVFLVESDSNDNTVQVLKKIQTSNPNFSFISKGKLSKKFPNRIARIAFCRNIYVEFVRNNYEKHLWSHVAVADLDGMNLNLRKKAVDSCFKTNGEWDGLMANQRYGYYDIYALRAKNWVEYDCFLELDKVKKSATAPKLTKYSLLNFIILFKYYDNFRKEIIYKKMKKISKNQALIKVDSAFGGFAIYKTNVFFNSNYTLSDSFSSEHVSFHKSKSNLQKLFYINPKLINNRLNEYTLNKFLFIRMLKESKKYFNPHNK